MSQVVVDFKDGKFVIGEAKMAQSEGGVDAVNEGIVCTMVLVLAPRVWGFPDSVEVVLTPAAAEHLDSTVLLNFLNGRPPYSVSLAEPVPA